MNIIDLIYTTLDKESEKEMRDKTSHYPSSSSIKLPNGKVIGKQLLDQYLEWRKVPPTNPTTPQSRMKFKLGDATHLALSKILSSNGIKVLHEVGAKYVHSKLQYPISYRVDSLIETPDGLAVLEIKTTQNNSIFGPWGVKENGPKLDHLIQTCCYIEMVPGVKYGLLLYIDRGSGGMAQFRIEKKGTKYTHGGDITFDGIIDRWVELEKHLKDNTQPEPDYKCWLSPDNAYMKVKTIKGQQHKSDWPLGYSNYLKYMIDNIPHEKFTYNHEFKQKGLI